MKLIQWVKICQEAPSISHLLFTDDSLVFCKAELVENSNLQGLLAIYEEASEQAINKEKTALTFSRNVTRATKEAIHDLWGNQSLQHEKYLGLPAIVGKSHRNAFSEIKQKLLKKLRNWKELLLSQEGKKSFSKQ